jgi:AcrR family transcriptional regulator
MDFADPIVKTRKGRATVEALKQGARVVFTRDGYIDARVSDIAEEAGLSSGAFYRYFTDKRHIMFCVLRQFMSESNDYVRVKFTADEPLRSIRLSTERYLRFYSEHTGMHRLLLQAGQVDAEIELLRVAGTEDWHARISRMLSRARALGLVDEAFDPDIAATLLGAMCETYAYLAYVMDRPMEKDPVNVAAQISRLWEAGAFRRASEVSALNPTGDR